MNTFTRFYHLLILFILPAILPGQIILPGEYFPEAGDTLHMAIDIQPSGNYLSPSGGDQTWDFTSLNADITRTRPVRPSAEGDGGILFPSTEVFYTVSDVAEGYYNVTANRFELVGYLGEDPIGQGIQVATRFQPAYVERWAPLQFFDQHISEAALLVAIAADDIPGGIFDTLPVQFDSIRVRVAVDRIDLVDAWGALSIPGGTYGVLREKRTEMRDVRLDIKAGFLPWIDITDLALEFLPIDQLGRDTLVRYYYWSDEAKEPVAIVNANATGQQVNTVDFKNNGPVSDVNEAIVSQVKIFPNPASNLVQIDMPDAGGGPYHFALIDASGKTLVYQSFIFTPGLTSTISLPFLPSGIYFFRIEANEGRNAAAGQLEIISHN
jgi:hypothetical protein